MVFYREFQNHEQIMFRNLVSTSFVLLSDRMWRKGNWTSILMRCNFWCFNAHISKLQTNFIPKAAKLLGTEFDVDIMLKMVVRFSILCTIVKLIIKLIAGHSGRAVWGVDLGRLVAGIVGSNPAQGMDVCPLSFCVVLSRVGRGLATGWSLVQGVLPYV
jgi:hypothetical protein